MNQIAPRWEGILAYAALVAVLAVCMHWKIGPYDLELSALLVVLGWIVPSLAVKPAASRPSGADTIPNLVVATVEKVEEAKHAD